MSYKEEMNVKSKNEGKSKDKGISGSSRADDLPCYLSLSSQSSGNYGAQHSAALRGDILGGSTAGELSKLDEKRRLHERLTAHGPVTRAARISLPTPLRTARRQASNCMEEALHDVKQWGSDRGPLCAPHARGGS